ncbi:IS110 family transposase [Streptomyces kronopolitis]
MPGRITGLRVSLIAVLSVPPGRSHLRSGRHLQHDRNGHSGSCRTRGDRWCGLSCRHRPRCRGNQRGGQIADAEFPTTTAGHTAALGFLAAHGTIAAVGVEGTSSYGSGFTHAAREAGLTVVEVNRPDKAERRRIGKSDPIEAYATARAVVSGRATSAPKGDAVAGIRALHNAARSAIKARTAAVNQIAHILITAPDSIRTKYEVLRGDKRIDALVRLRVGNDPVHIPALTALRTLARRIQNLTAERTALTAELDALVTQLNPGLRAAYGVGPDTPLRNC